MPTPEPHNVIIPIVDMNRIATHEFSLFLQNIYDKAKKDALNSTDIITISADYIVKAKTVIVLGDSTALSISVTLPNSLLAFHTNSSNKITICKIDSSVNTVTVNTVLGQKIGGSSSFVLSAQNDTVTLASNGSNWFII